MKVEPASFGKEHREMLDIAINPSFDKYNFTKNSSSRRKYSGQGVYVICSYL